MDDWWISQSNEPQFPSGTQLISERKTPSKRGCFALMAQLKKEKIPYTQVANAVLYDKDISLKAKGLFAYLFSKPDGWSFAADRIQGETSDGRKAVLAGLKELEDSGYLTRTKKQNGRVIYDLSFAKSPNGTKPKGHSAKTGTISKTDSESNTEERVINPSDAGASRDIAEIIDLFKKVNPSYQTLFGRDNQRAAVERLLKIYPRPQLDAVVKVLEETNLSKYAPMITTPIQLENNIGKLKAFIQGNRWAKENKGKDILGM